ncbi:MAG: hypothetical protein K2Q18_02595 [Bdellovibrionales bacterium]|nr:hypothetical protein [Bdellovibrionales bacterium]
MNKLILITFFLTLSISSHADEKKYFMYKYEPGHADYSELKAKRSCEVNFQGVVTESTCKMVENSYQCSIECSQGKSKDKKILWVNQKDVEEKCDLHFSKEFCSKNKLDKINISLAMQDDKGYYNAKAIHERATDFLTCVENKKNIFFDLKEDAEFKVCKGIVSNPEFKRIASISPDKVTLNDLIKIEIADEQCYILTKIKFCESEVRIFSEKTRNDFLVCTQKVPEVAIFKWEAEQEWEKVCHPRTLKINQIKDCQKFMSNCTGNLKKLGTVLYNKQRKLIEKKVNETNSVIQENSASSK